MKQSKKGIKYIGYLVTRYLPIEVIDSYSKRLVSPSIDEGYVFIKIYNENLDLIKELK